jgi:hypothetical protein
VATEFILRRLVISRWESRSILACLMQNSTAGGIANCVRVMSLARRCLP